MKLNSFVLSHKNSLQHPTLPLKDEIQAGSNIQSEISKLRRDLGFGNEFQQQDNSNTQTNTSNPNETLVNSNEIYRCLIQRDKIDDDTGSESEEERDSSACFIIYPDHFLKQIFDVIIIM